MKQQEPPSALRRSPSPPALRQAVGLALILVPLGAAWIDAIPVPLLPLTLTFAALATIWLAATSLKSAALPPTSDPRPPTFRLPPAPLLILAALVGISLANPSHQPTFETAAAPGGQLEAATKIKANRVFTPRDRHLPALPTTVDRAKTLHRATTLAAVIALGAAVTSLTRGNPSLIRAACWLVTLNGVAVALVSIYFKSTGNELILGKFEPINPRFFGPFRYNNFWAAWNILVAASASGLLLDALHRRRWLPATIAIAALVPLAYAVIASQSRSALLVSALFAAYLITELSLAVLRGLGLLKKSRVGLKKALVLATVTALVLAAATTITITSTWHRWATPEYAATQSGRFKDTIQQFSAMRDGHLPDLRLAMSRDTVKMALAKPVWGWGLGSFEYAFPLFAGPEFLEDRYQDQTNSFGKLIRPQYAHNDWAQYWAELGTIGFAALILALYRFLRPPPTATGVPRSPITRPLIAGALTVALFALWDFPLNNPAVMALLATTLALAVAAHPPAPTTPPPSPSPPVP